MRSLSVGAVLSLLIAAPLAGTSAGASGPRCQPWNQAEPTSGILAAVATLPDCEVWAVGGVRQTVALHLFGQAWTTVPSPDPGGPSRTTSLAGVAATSARDAWAVGDYSGGKAFRTLIAHWDGVAWTRVRSPNPGGAWSNGLFGVAASSARSAWAVGNYSDGRARQTLILRWDGRSWTQVPSPDPGGAAHDNKLTGVAIVSARNAWAVGYYQTARAFRRTLILHWDGRSWTQVPSPDPGGASHGNLLFGVAATSARNAWAVGYDTTSSGATTLVLHWNGRSWSRQPSPNRAPGGPPRIDQLQGVAATSASNAWAVGYYEISGGGFYTLALHWDGTRWQWAPSPDPGGDNDFLIGVAAGSVGDAWAVGGYDLGQGGREQSFVLHWNGTAWQD